MVSKGSQIIPMSLNTESVLMQVISMYEQCQLPVFDRSFLSSSKYVIN